MAIKKPSLKDYYFNEKDPAVKLTMEAMDISREETIKIMKDLSYKINFPKKKKIKEHIT